MLRPTLFPSRLLRQQPVTAPLRQFLSTAPSPPSPTPAPPPQGFSESRTRKPERKPTYPFGIGRSATNNFSVYQLAKRGGNLKITVVKKVEGNRIAFKEELGKALRLSPRDIKVSSLTGHVEVPGHRKPEIVAFFEERGL
ncbi:mitochondrial large subunit ribosomal protein-domain-containing protein [Triangularia verruculosa]|uniref:Large ribosomal subunit protein mL49 n=1 Tax=Triangularia verruculosa TaxID=2587418 RepID=A0AAN7AS17_9PEZI|nr:mitochondrial large subunit ribosomal protein-domain-containing protein [Triangularia verruculosa]